MIQEIKDIYSYRKEDNSAMLSMYDADFWKPYRDNFPYYDRLFMKKYRSWFPMDQEGDLEEISTDFAYDVKAWLMINDKRYSELFRINQVVDDEHYTLTDNVYEEETIHKETENNETFNKGSETITDTTVNQYGQKTETVDRDTVLGAHTITEDNEASFASQTDSENKSAAFAARTDTEDKSASFAARSDSESKSHVFGQQLVEVDGTVTQGSGRKQTTNSTSAFNESSFTPTDSTEEVEDSRTETTNMDTTNGAHTDTESNSFSYGAHTDTEDNSYVHGAHTDTESNSYVHGAHTDTEDNITTLSAQTNTDDITSVTGTHTDNLSNSRVDGAREDEKEGTGSEDITRVRSGNIGVKDVPQMLGDQRDFWIDFSFYELVFAEIARELLRGWR